MNKTFGSFPSKCLPLLFACGAFLADSPSLRAQSASVSVNAGSVVRTAPIGLRGVCAGGFFWRHSLPNYREEMMAANIGMVRISAYPTDSTSNVASVADLDIKVAQILNAGATPLFIQAINDAGRTHSDAADVATHAKYLDLNGNVYPAGSTVPTAQRIATNMTYLVKRYKAAPFNLSTQYWEVGNEPDLKNPNYKVENAAEYIADFQAVHNQLNTSGVRGNVVLAGPALSWDYGYETNGRDATMDAFLSACKDQVNVVTRHIYAKIYSWEGKPYTPYTLLNSTSETLHFDSSYVSSSGRGEGNLLAEMNARGVPANVGTGVTEMNLFENDNGSLYNYTITQGLWFLLSNHYALYNPRSLLTNSFQFDLVAHSGIGGELAFFDSGKNRSYAYWAAYMQNALSGAQVLTQNSSDSHVVVTATKDASHLYVRLLNRHNTSTYVANVTINNAPPVSSPTVYTLSATERPNVGVPFTYGTTFSRPLPPMTACIIRYPRTDAPQPPVTPAPPTMARIDTGFDSTPTGAQIYGVGFTPLIGSGTLQLTKATVNTRGAVVFNGQALTAATSRVQARFGFKVAHPNAEGFVFGAYSSTPGAVGNAGTALGYEGQANRIWGVKVDNNPDEFGIVAGSANGDVEGWVSKRIDAYSGTNMFAVVDYDGAAGTVRARLYQGTSDAGTLWADITNKVGNPANLPVGTVFGFAGASGSNYSQTTYIDNLKVLIDDGFVVGQSLVMDSSDGVASGVVRSPNNWNFSNATPGALGGNYYHDGDARNGACTATYTPGFAAAGWRDVYARWTQAHANRASNTLFTVNHATGSAQVRQSQKVDGSGWVKLGTWYFQAGSGNVVINNLQTDGVVIADGIQFVNVIP